jgi:hypothetical protein
MAQSKSPRQLRDVSHLFLSVAEPAGRDTDRRIEAIVWLAVLSPSLNRAHLAAGAAAAIGRQGITVSLLEVCTNLPNIGYYFAMDPADYIGSTLERSGITSGTWEDNVRFFFTGNPASFRFARDRSAPSRSPHVALAAFSHPADKVDVNFFFDLRKCLADFQEPGDPRTGIPDSIVVFRQDDGSGHGRKFMEWIRNLFPEAIIFLAEPKSSEDVVCGAAERITLPDDLRSSWTRRMPPGERFFSDLASGLLEVLSHRRRKALRDAAIR